MNKLSNLSLVARCNQYFKIANEITKKELGFDPEETDIEAPEGWDDETIYDNKLDGLPNSDLGSNYSKLTEPVGLTEEEIANAEPKVIDIIAKLQEDVIKANGDALSAVNELSSFPSELTNQVLLIAKKMPNHIAGIFSSSNNILEIMGSENPRDNDIYNTLSELKEHIRYINDALHIIRNIEEGMDEDSNEYYQTSLLAIAFDKIIDIGVRSIKELKTSLVKKKRVNDGDWQF